jgi:riboflavin synthase
MFTGIVQGIGRVTRVEARGGGRRLSVRPPSRFGRFRKGESISVSGVCLTALESSAIFRADLSPETLARSSFSTLKPGDAVNLERAVRLADRLSGHLVQGHVDARVRLLSVAASGEGWTFRFELPRKLSRYVVEKGSVALDGISLTVASRRKTSFDVAIIPHTYRATNLGARRAGERVNLEVDVIAKYVESMLPGR